MKDISQSAESVRGNLSSQILNWVYSSHLFENKTKVIPICVRLFTRRNGRM